MRGAVLVFASGCSSIFGLEAPARLDASVPVDEDLQLDAPPDGQPGPWYDVRRAFASTENDDDPTLTGDMLEMFIDRGFDIYVLRRPTMADAWSAPVRVAELSTTSVDTTPKVSTNGLAIVLASNRQGSMGADVWLALRMNRSDAWSSPVLFTALNSAAEEAAGSGTSDTLLVSFASNRNGNFDLFLASRPNVNVGFDPPVAIAELNSPAADASPFLTDDGQNLYFDSGRGTSNDLYVSTRSGPGAWMPPTPIDELNTPAFEGDPWVSPDGTTIYFTSDRDGRMGIWTARRDL